MNLTKLTSFLIEKINKFKTKNGFPKTKTAKDKTKH